MGGFGLPLLFMKYNWTPLENIEIKWIGVDWDDTIASNSGFPDFIPGEPLPGALEALKAIDDMGYKITIYTARPWSDYQNIERYCEHYGIKARRIICGKPLFKWIIDDKNIEFKGNWQEALHKVWKGQIGK